MKNITLVLGSWVKSNKNRYQSQTRQALIECTALKAILNKRLKFCMR